MEQLTIWFHEYPVIAGLAFGLIVLLVLGAVLGTLMYRSGMSLKPLLWFFVLMLLVGGPQAAMHVLDVIAFHRQQGGALSADSAPSAGTRLTPIPWHRVFGKDADPALMVDPRLPLQAILGEAENAELSFTRLGTSALAARFPSPEQAVRARMAYANFFQFTYVTGSDAAGWTAQRYGGSGEWNHVVSVGAELYAWTGPSRDSVVTQREQALGPLGDAGSTPASLADVKTLTPKRAHEARLVTGNLDWQILLPFATINLAAVVLWFFWGTAWATRISPQVSTPAAPSSVLRGKLLAAYAGDSAIKAKANRDGSITLDWNYADAACFDLMRVHKIKHTERLVLYLDEAARSVRVREYWSTFDASAGLNGLRLDWRASTGIQFFRFEQQTLYGLQLDAAGLPTGELSHTYRVDLQAMKQPAIDTVTGAGWRWQPVLSNGPGWLSWLTG